MRTTLRSITLLSLIGTLAVAPVRAAGPTYATNFGLSGAIMATGNSITASYYGWEATTWYGQTLYAFTVAEYGQNSGNNCFSWNGCSANNTIAGVSLGTKPYLPASNPYLVSPVVTTFGWGIGTEIIFALMVNQNDGFNWFFSGDPNRNGDRYAHLAFFSPALFPNGVPGNGGNGVVPNTAGKNLFGFEDVIYHDSDWDFDNAIFSLDAGATPTEVVPEPATMTLLAAGLAGLSAAQFRRRRREAPTVE